MKKTSPHELKLNLDRNRDSILVLDVREPWEFETCRIDKSVLIPIRQITANASQLDKSQETVVVCHHGVRSLQVCFYLESIGFTNVVNLDGGLARWAREVDPQMKTY